MDWINFESQPPSHGYNGICIAKFPSGRECRCYYYDDKVAWTRFYGHRLTHWYEYPSGEPIYEEATHWKPLEKIKKE